MGRSARGTHPISSFPIAILASFASRLAYSSSIDDLTTCVSA